MKKQLLLALCFIFAFCLDIIKLPAGIDIFRPFLSLMMLIFWSLIPQSNIHVTHAWILGLCVDALTGSLIGQHAFTFTLICLLIKLNSKLLTNLALLQQTLLISLCFVFYALFDFWLARIQGYSNISIISLVIPIIVSSLLWPWIYNLLIEFCYIFQIKIK